MQVLPFEKAATYEQLNSKNSLHWNNCKNQL